MKNKKKLKMILFLLFAGIVAGGSYYLSKNQILTMENLKENISFFRTVYQENQALTLGIFFVVYIMITAFSLPGATLLTLSGGWIFGIGKAFLLISFASSIGATLAMLSARYFFSDFVRGKFGEAYRKINRQVEKEGALYLITLRLAPVFPFFMINLVMGLVKIPAFRFYWVSQLSMIPGTFVYVYAGSRLNQIDSLAGIVSPSMLSAFFLLAAIPWLSKVILQKIKEYRLYRPFPKPPVFDRNLIVIGAGPGGLIASYLAAKVKAKVTLIEADKPGGDCLNRGCIPSKTLIASAGRAREIREAGKFGLETAGLRVNFPEVMKRIRENIRKISIHDSFDRYTSLGVECLKGKATLLSPYEVSVQTEEGVKKLTSKSILLAGGAKPKIPDWHGLNQIPYLSSDNIWNLEEVPRKLLVIGGGPVGCELAQAFHNLGSSVEILLKGNRLLPKEETEAAQALEERFLKEGLRLHKNTEVLSFEQVEQAGQIERVEPREAEASPQEKRYRVHTQQGTEKDKRGVIEFTHLLIAVGRSPSTQGLGLENLGIELNPDGGLPVNERGQTLYPNLYACGDITSGSRQFTHFASRQAQTAAGNALFGKLKKFKTDSVLVPRITYTAPEIAAVGLSEADAQAQGIPHEVYRLNLEEQDRYLTDGEEGFIKIIVKAGTDRLLGCLIVAEDAGSLLQESLLLMRHKIGLNKLLNTIHPYPIKAEALKTLAGRRQEKHLPQRLIRLSEKYLSIGIRKEK